MVLRSRLALKIVGLRPSIQETAHCHQKNQATHWPKGRYGKLKETNMQEVEEN